MNLSKRKRKNFLSTSNLPIVLPCPAPLVHWRELDGVVREWRTRQLLKMAAQEEGIAAKNKEEKDVQKKAKEQARLACPNLLCLVDFERCFMLYCVCVCVCVWCVYVRA